MFGRVCSAVSYGGRFSALLTVSEVAPSVCVWACAVADLPSALTINA